MKLISDKLNEWANKYVPKFNELNVNFYTQSPLDKATDVDIMVIGINPKGDTIKGYPPLTAEEYLKGNKTWDNRFNPDGTISKGWSKYLHNARFFLGCNSEKKTDLPIDDDRRTVWTNLVPIPSQNGFNGLTNEMRQIGVLSTLELIDILKPKRIIFFSVKAFDLLKKYAPEPDKIEHINVIDKMPLEIGYVNGIPAVSVKHPSQRWVVSNTFIPVFIFLHKLICERGAHHNLNQDRDKMRQEIKLWVTRIGLNENGNLEYKG